MVNSGMVHMFDSGADVIEDGIFGISNTRDVDSPQRVVWDGRRSNHYFHKWLAAVVLSSPDMLGEVYLPSAASLFTSTSDI